MGNLDRRKLSSTSCVVCGTSDARILSSTRLLDGERVTVCGSHKVAHHKSERIASTVEELREIVGDRRRRAS